MAKTISFASQKGGVGKSSLLIQTAFYLAIKRKKKVLVVDMDGQGNSSSRLAPRVDFEGGGFEAQLAGTKASDLFQDELDGPIEELECPYGIDLIHTPKDDPELFEMEGVPLEWALNPARHIESIAHKYDYILVDCPPSLGRGLVAALLMSTHVVCPVKLSGFAVDGVEGLLKTIIGIREDSNPDLEVAGIIINDMDASVSHQRAFKELKAEVPEMLFKNIIRHRPPFDTATSDGIPIWELRYGHVAAKEVQAVLKELVSKVG